MISIGRVCLLACMFVPTWHVICQADDRDDFFEQKIRPILVTECSACHGANKQSSNLRVDSLESLLKGGDLGPAVVPGKPDESLLLEAVKRGEDLAMPPESALKDHQIDALRQWIESGARWPESVGLLESMQDRSAAEHWAFQPVRQPAVPELADDEWTRTPIDSFILKSLQDNGLKPNVTADRRTLIRRASYDLTGLPPAADQTAAFVADDDPEAWGKLVDRLLQSDAYGQQWARHWLDVARYADTKGYVYAREERFWIHAWTYRDWVIDALNADMPYDRFLLLQLAADQVEDRRRSDLAAMGFLTLGRRFLGVPHDIIDDRIDVVSRGTMGLTVSCARCHDHKYDPIPTADYYSLYGVFDSCAEKLEPLSDEPVGDAEYQQELKKRQQTLIDARATRAREATERIRRRVGEYLYAQTELHKYPRAGFDQVISAEDLHPRIVLRWKTWLYNAERRRDPVFAAWNAFKQLPEESFAQASAEVLQRLQQSSADEVNPLVVAAITEPPSAFTDVVNAYSKLLTSVDEKWQTQLEAAKASSSDAPQALTDPAEEQLRQVLYGPGSPCVIPTEHIANTELLFDSPSVNALWKEQGEFDRWLIQAKFDVPYATTLVDRPVPSEPRIFRRGSSTNLGDPVERHFLSLFSEQTPDSFTVGSGRRELAEAIIDPSNPLTARVIVNRVWAHHFGQGLVLTPSDFGLRAQPPSHPELLDWLTSWFVENGWSLKKLHRLIMTSAIYQQASQVADQQAAAAAQELDPDNRLLWRMTPHRLTFEEYRDSLLAASGELDTTAGGKPFDLFNGSTPRRTVYGLVDRQFLPGTLRTFNFANPDLHIAQRAETTVPQQALFSLNHKMVLDRVRILAGKLDSITDAAERVRYLFRQTLQREPTDAELEDSLALISLAVQAEDQVVRPTVADWSYGYGAVDETAGVVADFAAIPHFTGTAWQGGANWPDANLGWVNLTAVGGHPGNTRQHACVRRWTAPADMTISLTSKLVHEPAAGDGIRAFVLASSQPQSLHATKVHQQTADLNTESLTVKAGDHLDFVVDIDEVLNSDQFLWKISLTELQPAGATARQWDSEQDFTVGEVDGLTPWQQLAHVLLCMNEFMFVD